MPLGGHFYTAANSFIGATIKVLRSPAKQHMIRLFGTTQSVVNTA